MALMPRRSLRRAHAPEEMPMRVAAALEPVQALGPLLLPPAAARCANHRATLSLSCLPSRSITATSKRFDRGGTGRQGAGEAACGHLRVLFKACLELGQSLVHLPEMVIAGVLVGGGGRCIAGTLHDALPHSYGHPPRAHAQSPTGRAE